MTKLYLSYISEAPRLHHQLEPMTVDYQTGFSPEVLDWLRSRGHTTYDSGYFRSVVGAIGRTEQGSLVAVADSRKAGGVAGINSSPHTSSTSPPSSSSSLSLLSPPDHPLFSFDFNFLTIKISLSQSLYLYLKVCIHFLFLLCKYIML